MWAKMLSLLIIFFSSVTKLYPPIPTYQPGPLTLDQIYSSDHSWTATLSAQKKLVIVAVGDIMPARTITASRPGSDFSYLYDSTRDLISSADLSLANLETPITVDCAAFTTGMRFCAPLIHLSAIKAAGFDVLSLANNHIYDQGETGFNITLQGVASVGLTALPPNVPEYLTLKRQKIAFIGVSYIPGLKQITPTDRQLKDIVTSAATDSDIVIVMPHWGVEYTAIPTSEQVRLAHLMVDSGADLVLGSHPHWIQTSEIYNDRLIVYSHGNFVFDQFWSDKTRRGIVGTYVFFDRRLVDASFTPVHINLSGKPEIASPSGQ